MLILEMQKSLYFKLFIIFTRKMRKEGEESVGR